jgi:hypothetical protein
MNCIYCEPTDASCAGDNSRLLIAMKCTEREKENKEAGLNYERQIKTQAGGHEDKL